MYTAILTRKLKKNPKRVRVSTSFNQTHPPFPPCLRILMWETADQELCQRDRKDFWVVKERNATKK